MLDTQTFERLLLHWGKNVRIFFIRCLMWRVGRVWHSFGIRWNSEAEQMVKMMVRGNNDAVMCDGHSCWSQWMDRSSKAENTVNLVSAEMKAYQQCSLYVTHNFIFIHNVGLIFFFSVINIERFILYWKR